MTPSSLEEFQELIRVQVDPVTRPAIAYGVSRGNEILIQGAFGLADVANRRPAVSDTPFAMASVTKPMTGTVLKLLAERGLIDLDAPINEYMPDAPIQSRAGDATGCTIRRVADHSSGLPSYCRFYYADESEAKLPFREVARCFGKTFTRPGERHVYSNLGYGYLDQLIERITGRPYAEAMRSELFELLGMARSTIGRPAHAPFALSYGKDGVAYPDYGFDHPGGSAAYSSVADLLKFGMFHLGFGPDLLTRTALGDCHMPTSKINDGRGYGLGWAIGAPRLGCSSIDHSGYMGGVNTVVRLVPELEATIVILFNGEADSIFNLTHDAIAAISPEYRARLIEDRAATLPTPQPHTFPEPLVGRWSGAIETHTGSAEMGLEVLSAERALVEFDGATQTLQSFDFGADRIYGTFDGDLGLDDKAIHPYRLHLNLASNESGLIGAVATGPNASAAHGGTAGRHMGNWLSYWAALTRA